MIIGRVASVNIGQPRTMEWLGRPVMSGTWKSPVDGPVEATPLGIVGDGQADLEVHGGVDKAVYAYAAEDEAWWSTELVRPLEPGAFGENLTTEGIDLTAARIGEHWAIGTAVLEVAQPRVPCYKLGMRMGDPTFPPRFAAAARPGAYLRVIEPGRLTVGDAITRLSQPGHTVTVGSIERAYHLHDHDGLEAIMAAPALPETWIDLVERRRTR